ncbi:MAG: legume lectin beta domain protein [Acidimicrobiales bacterium]|nr:legume lectin beta domain protein [Acidimicrobiales bacterium]
MGGMRRDGASARAAGAIAVMAMIAGFTVAASAADVSTVSVDVARTGWDQAQPNLAPATVGSSFGPLFTAQVDGQVYAQPLVSGNVVIAATENATMYGLDATTGAVIWQRHVGNAFPASAVPCGDLTPLIGFTSTPVIDANGWVYTVGKTYDGVDPHSARFAMYAFSVANGAAKPGWPVDGVFIGGVASNDPTSTLGAFNINQRAGLLLMNGVAYAALGSSCDVDPYRGWVAGVSTSAGTLSTLWTDEVGGGTNPTAGIWMSGGGIASDGSGQMLLSSGNGIAPPVGPGTSPPATLGNSIFRLAVQSNGTLKATDFFTPSNVDALNQNDLDLGSSGPSLLPDSFGTPSHPHLMVQGGKEGKVYLMDRDKLGGRAQGPGGTDAVLSATSFPTGMWGHTATWGGDGGWVYGSMSGGSLFAMARSVTAAGDPQLVKTGTSVDALGFGSGSPVVTSNGTTAGSALVWVVRSPDGSGVGADLRAYDAVPVNGTLQLRWKSPTFKATKFTVPATSNGRVFVGTRDGTVLAFRSTAPPPMAGNPVSFANTKTGQSRVANAVFTAGATVTVNSLAISGAPFSMGAATPAVPTTLAAGKTLTIPVTFSPANAGNFSGTLTANTSSGPFSLTLSGIGTTTALSVAPTSVDFGNVQVGRTVSGGITIYNGRAGALTISSVTPPAAPFGAASLPAAGTNVPGKSSLSASVSFAPTAAGTFNGSLVLNDNLGETITVPLKGNGVPPGHLTITPTTVDFGTIATGTAKTLTFDVGNTGAGPLVISKAKPPAGTFSTSNPLPEGLTMAPGSHRSQTVTFAPTTPGAASATYVITGDDGQGPITVNLVGSGSGGPSIVPDPTAGGWQLNGAASIVGTQLQLTPAVNNVTGTGFWPTSVASSTLTVGFDATIDTGSGADGMTLALIDPALTAKFIGSGSNGMGYSGATGVAIALDTFANAGDPNGNFIGIAQTGDNLGLHYLATATNVPGLQNATHHLTVTINAGQISVSIDAAQVLTATITLPPQVLVGFTGATGGLNNRYAASHLYVSGTAGPPPPPPPGPVTDPSKGGWQLNGAASIVGTQLQLTPNTAGAAGSGFWPTALSSNQLTVDFDATIDTGTGADGMTLTLANPAASATALGAAGSGLGYGGINGVAVALDTYQSPGDPSGNFVGIATSGTANSLTWAATSTATVPPLRNATHHVTVIVSSAQFNVKIDGLTVLTSTVTLPPQVLLGFTAGTGGLTDRHAVANVAVTVGGSTPPPPAVPDPTAGGWKLNGSASIVSGLLQLTPATNGLAGSAFWPNAVSSNAMTIDFDATIDTGNGADGLTLTLANPTAGASALGAGGSGEGFGGINGIAISLDTYQSGAGDPSGNFIGVATSGDASHLVYAATSGAIAALDNATHHITVTLNGGVLNVKLDGLTVITTNVRVTPQVLIGFTAGTGGLNDRHAVKNLVVTLG